MDSPIQVHSDSSEIPSRSSLPTSKKNKPNSPRKRLNNKTAGSATQKPTDTMEEEEEVGIKPPRTLNDIRAEVDKTKEGSEHKRRGRVVEKESSGGDGGRNNEATSAETVLKPQVNGETTVPPNVVPGPANKTDSSIPTSPKVASPHRSGDHGADDELDLWESFVVEFQEEMQEYRTMVVHFAEGEETCDFESAERRLRSIGHRLAQTAEDTKTDATKKTRARQLLQYVSDYCQSHGRDELHAAFVAYIASCTKG